MSWDARKNDVKPSLSVKIIEGIDIVSLVGYFDEIQGAGFDLDEKSVSASGRLPVHPQFPTVKVSTKTNRRESDVLSDKIVSNAALPDVPIIR